MDVMSVVAHPTVRSRRRNLAELYVRAYWRPYSAALIWVLSVQVLVAVVLER